MNLKMKAKAVTKGKSLGTANRLKKKMFTFGMHAYSCNSCNWNRTQVLNT